MAIRKDKRRKEGLERDVADSIHFVKAASKHLPKETYLEIWKIAQGQIDIERLMESPV